MFFRFFHIWELGASRYAINTPTGCRNIFHYRPSHSQDFPKIDLLYTSPNRRRPNFVAALSRQIADFQGPAYIPKRAERPTYWKVLPPFFERIQESRVIAFSVEKRQKTPKVSDLPKCEMSTMFV